MNHKGTVTIETERLILRRFQTEDSEAAFRNWMSVPEVTRFLTWPVHKSRDVSESLLRLWAEEYRDMSSYQWAIVLKEIGEPIGSISVVRMDEEVDMMEIGYCIGNRWWHQGITSEALRAVLKFLFEEVSAKRIQAKHDVRNPNSGKVMQKCGMTFEGVLRSYARNNTGIVDTAMYSILPGELKM